MTSLPLQLVHINDQGQELRLQLVGRTRIGRLSSLELTVSDRAVSKVHAVIFSQGGRWLLEDAGSRNGTTINGTFLEGRHSLSVGDVIGMGSSSLSVELAPPPRRTGSFNVVDDQPGKIRKTLAVEHLGSRTEASPASSDHEYATAREAARAELSERAEYEKLRLAYELTRAVLGESDVEALFDRILEAAVELFKADRGLILLGSSSDALEPVATKLRGQETGDHFEVPGSILRQVVDERQAVLSNDASLDERFGSAHSVRFQNIRATMSVPLLYKDQLHGAIHLDCLLSVGVFTEHDLHLLVGFAEHAAHLLEHAQLLEARQQQLLTRERLARLLPPGVVNQVVDGRIRLERGGYRTEATVIFADIRGFTSWSERSQAEEIVEGLNSYFDEMVDVVFRWNGTLDKFIGDEIMAVWGAPLASPTHCEDAVRAALEMRAGLERLNEARARAGREPLRAGIGVNTGTVIAGYMGSRRSMSWTVIGDSVNVAARLCAAAAPDEILITDSIRDRLSAHLQLGEASTRRFKGKERELNVWPLLGWSGGEPQNS